MTLRTAHLRARASRAYTLLELVLVLAIIATTIAAAAPMLSAFARGRRAEEAARQFVALTRYARSQAVTDGVTYQLAVDTSAGQWRLMVQQDAPTDASTGATAAGPTATEATGPFARVYSVPEGVEIQSQLPLVNGVQTITFDPTGRCDTGVVHFVGHGSDVTVACDNPTEVYRVLKNNGGQS